MAKIVAPSWAEINSPFSLRNFKAFHSLGLWLAVNMIPAWALAFVTYISTVGVVEYPRSITWMPIPTSVCMASWLTISPEILPSLPTTTEASGVDFKIQAPNPATLSTMSTGVRLSPRFPPMVPLIPEIDLIKAKIEILSQIKIFWAMLKTCWCQLSIF